MKKQLFLTLAISFYFTTGFGQQFSFQVFFSDAVGNRDTITLGYDQAATNGIDAAFGETDILSVPFDTNLDVRITSPWITDMDPITFSTKKQIVFYDCTYNNWSIQPINIFTHHWPVTVTWDNSLFNDPCRYGSVFTSVNPGGWWDTGCPSNLWQQVLQGDGTVTFTTNVDPSGVGWFSYINSQGDSIPVFWQAFGDSNLISLSIPDIANEPATLQVFPNPTTNFLNIKVSDGFGSIELVEIYSAIGKKVLFADGSSTINLSSLSDGTYFIVVTNERGERLKTAVTKR